MRNSVAVAIVGAGIIALILLTLAIVYSGAKQTRDNVVGSLQENSFKDNSITVGLFSLGPPIYNDPEPCENGTARAASLNMYMDYHSVPTSCNLFINQRLTNEILDLDPRCVGACPSGSFARTVALGELDPRDNHFIRVCCDGICLDKALEARCN